MKDMLIVLKYALNYKKNALLNLIFNLISTFFSLFSIALLIPFLQILVGKSPAVEASVPFTFNMESITHNFYYFLSHLIQTEGKIHALVFISLIMIVGSFLKLFFGYAASYFMAPVMNGTVQDFQKKIFAKILELPLSFFSEEKKGDIMSRASGDINEIMNAVTNFLEVAARDPLQIIGFLIFLIYISGTLTAFVFLFIPLIAFAIGKLGKSLKRNSVKGQAKLGEIMSVTEETLGGLRVIKAFNAENKMTAKYQEKTGNLFYIMNKVTRRNSLSNPVSEFLGTLVIVTIVIYGGSLVVGAKSSLSGEQFITFIIAFSQILTPAKSISKAYNTVKKGAASIERVNEILNTENTIIENPGAVSAEDFKHDIEFKNVSFRYKETYVLKNINLKIEKGQTVALVGQSGSGKSTMVDLLPRFYDIEEGEILIDGINIKNINMKSLRHLMGNVNQEAILFNDSIFNNIAFGVETATQKDVEHAAKVANAEEFILANPEKYEYNIGDRGGKLSGGQRQRVSIARAVLKNPPILILDEATSALDSESERLVQDALTNLMKNRTSIVIAHRLSTVKHADLICVMHEGKIIERGKHDELILKDGTYKKLHDLQMF
jgi:subfamily B ATP-binding cassette protein MsbA